MPESGRLAAATGPYGGFDHNAQSLKVVTRLERKYAAFDGLNLSLETLEGLVKHNGPLTGERDDERVLRAHRRSDGFGGTAAFVSVRAGRSAGGGHCR
jgi:dGTP triphosphohydrolase